MDKKALTPAQYWEWRTTISELSVAQEKLRVASLEHKLLSKDAENLAIRTQLFLRTRMETAKGGLEQAQTEYERYKGVLEKSLGVSLNDKVIDDVTFEIKELPVENNTQPTKAEE